MRLAIVLSLASNEHAIANINVLRVINLNYTIVARYSSKLLDS